MSRQAKITDLLQFANRIRAVRKRMALNQAEFGQLGGVVMNSQNRYEAGATEPGLTYLASLAANRVDVGYILTGRASSESIDAGASAVVEAIQPFSIDERLAFAALLTTLRGSPAPARSAPGPQPALPSEAALLQAFQTWLSVTPGLTLDELPHELATMLPSILQGAADELPAPASDRPDAPPAPPATARGGNRANGRARRT